MRLNFSLFVLFAGMTLPAEDKVLTESMARSKDTARDATALSPNTTVPFTLPATLRGTLAALQYSLVVPSGTTRAIFELRTQTGGVDNDLYVRVGQEVGITPNQRPQADYIGEGLTGDETITVDNPRAGTYYIGFGIFTANVASSATIRVTLVGGGGGGTGNYNGDWTGTTSQGRTFTMTVANNVVTQIVYGVNWSVGGNCPSGSTTTSNPSLAITSGTFSNTSVTGSFSSDTTASGTLRAVLSINGPTQFCNQTLNLTWTASRSGGGTPTYTISGVVTDAIGAGVSGVTMTLSGSATQTVATSASGQYEFSNLAGGGTYTVTPSKASCLFTPPNRVFAALSGNQTGQGFDANCSSTSGSSYSFIPITPCRVMDTRAGQGKTGAFGPPRLSADSTREIPVPQSGCGVPSTAKAYSLNFTVLPAGILSYLSTWPSAQPRPVVSTLNSFHGGVVANAAIVPAGANGGINVYVTDAADVIIDINGYFDTPGVSNALDFFTVTPCRIADTRGAPAPFGTPILFGGASRTFPLLSSACGLPPSARAYSLNATVVPPGSLGYLTLFPSGGSQPLVSTLNSFDGAVVANAAIVPAGTSGSINAFVTDPTEFILDTNGFFAPPSTGSLKFYPVTPCRVADTRAGQGPILTGGAARTFPVGGVCNVPANAQAFSMNVTVVPTGALSYLTLWPAGQTQPVVSTLNSFQGRVLANAALVPAGAGGSVSVFVTNNTHVILDINGYFAP